MTSSWLRAPEDLRTLSTSPFTLSDLGLVDGPACADLDELVSLAADVLDAPMSLVSIVQEELDRQFFTSQVGLSAPWDQRRQTPLSHSFCRLVVQHDEVLRIDRAADDPRVTGNLAISEMGVRSYLGAPVYDSAGQAIGALCVIDGGPRAWTDAEQATLVRLATCVTNTIRLKSQVLTVQASEAEHLNFNATLAEDLRAPRHSARLLVNDLQTEVPLSVRSGQLQCAIDLASRLSDWLEGLSEGVEEHLMVLAEPGAAKPVVALSSVLDDVIDDLGPHLNASLATTDIGPLPTVRGNAAQLQLLFKNLLADAIRRQRDNVPLHISVATGPCPVTGHIRVRVTDNGLTEARNTREELLGFLVRLDRPEGWREPSAGISLRTSTRVVAHHRGALSFTFGPDFSTAVVDLPAATQHRGQANPQSDTAR